jgi:transcriptional regulator with XRE-family HTH domain
VVKEKAPKSHPEAPLVLSIGVRLRSIMESRGLNRDRLEAALSGRGDHVSNGNLGRLIRGVGNPTLRTLTALALYLGKRPWELLATDQEVAETILRAIKKPPDEPSASSTQQPKTPPPSPPLAGKQIRAPAKRRRRS